MHENTVLFASCSSKRATNVPTGTEGGTKIGADLNAKPGAGAGGTGHSEIAGSNLCASCSEWHRSRTTCLNGLPLNCIVKLIDPPVTVCVHAA